MSKTPVRKVDILETTSKWFDAAVPFPTARNFQVQVGVHLEEVTEMLDTLQGTDRETDAALFQAYNSLKHLADGLKSGGFNVVISGAAPEMNLLDALCDQIVTAVGVAHMCKFDVLGGMMEVNRSNFSKFVDGAPQFNNGKIAKGPEYSPPNLAPFV